MSSCICNDQMSTCAGIKGWLAHGQNVALLIGKNITSYRDQMSPSAGTKYHLAQGPNVIWHRDQMLHCVGIKCHLAQGPNVTFHRDQMSPGAGTKWCKWVAEGFHCSYHFTDIYVYVHYMCAIDISKQIEIVIWETTEIFLVRFFISRSGTS